MSRRPGAYRRRVLLNTVSIGAGNVWAMVVAFASLPLLLHGLGQVAFGTWVLLQTFSAITGWLSLAGLGASTATTKSVAEYAAVDDHRGVSQAVGSALSLFAAVGVISAVALALIGPRVFPDLFGTPARIADDLRAAVVLFSAQVLLELLTIGFCACLEGLQRLDLSRAADAVRRTAVAGATVTAALRGDGLQGVAAASLGATAVGMIVAALLLVRQMPARPAPPSPRLARSLLAYGSMVGVLDAAGVLHRTMDRLIVGGILGPASVTLVEIATQVQNGAAAVLSASSYTAISASSWLSAREDRRTLRELLDRGTKYSMLVTMPFVVGAVVLAGPAVRLWVGIRYAEAAGLVAVAVLYIATNAPIAVASNLLTGTGHARSVVIPAVVAVLFNFAASIVLVHLVGVVGVFVATLLSAAILVPFVLRAALRQTELDLAHFVSRAVAPSALPSLAMLVLAGAVVALPLGDLTTVLVGGATGLAAYAGVSARWSIQRSELQELSDLVGRRAPDG